MSLKVTDLRPEQVHLFQTFRSGDITEEAKEELFAFVGEIRDIPGFTLKEFVMKEFGYNEHDARRLNSDSFRWRRKKEALGKGEGEGEGRVPRKLVEKTRGIEKGATEKLLSEVKELGELLVTHFSKNAANKGETLKDYVLKSIEFREEHGDQLELLLQQNDMFKALCSILADAAKPQFKQIAITRIYLDWLTTLLQMETMGYNINTNAVASITQKLEEGLGIVLEA